MKKFLLSITMLTITLMLNSQFANAAQVSSDRTSTPVNIYIVKRGDNLWNIAKRYHCTVKQLKQINPQLQKGGDEYAGITEGEAVNIIKPNESLEIPETETLTDVEAQVLTLVNQVRVKNGLSELQGDDNNLNKSARAKSKDMSENNYFSHQSPTLGSPFDQMRTFGVNYKSAGENIAQGQKTAQSVMDDWMNSSGHRANILNKQFTHCGVGYVNGYWVQQFVGK